MRKCKGKNFFESFKGILKKGDLILVAILIVAVALTIWIATKDSGNVAEIYIDGKLSYSLDLDKDTAIDVLDGEMTVVVKNGEIFVYESDCNEQICVHSAPISKEGGIIVCLPNKVVIKVTSREVDAIS